MIIFQQQILDTKMWWSRGEEVNCIIYFLIYFKCHIEKEDKQDDFKI